MLVVTGGRERTADEFANLIKPCRPQGRKGRTEREPVFRSLRHSPPKRALDLAYAWVAANRLTPCRGVTYIDCSPAAPSRQSDTEGERGTSFIYFPNTFSRDD